MVAKQKCIRCGEVKPLADYYAHPGMANGHLGRCKVCHRAEARRVRGANVDRYRAYDRERSKDPIRRSASVAKARAMRARPFVVYAHNAVARAVKSGALVRPDHCCRCLISCSPQAHHEDHSKALDVQWLCPICHAVRHREMGKLRTIDAPLFV